MADSKEKVGRHKYAPSVTYLPVLPPAIPVCPPPDSPPEMRCMKPQCSRIQCPRIRCPRIECPKLEFPRIDCPVIDICPPTICCSVDFEAAGSSLGRSSYASCDTVERESNMITYTDATGKTVLLCSEGSERQATVMNRKDSKGLSHTYCKEIETKSHKNACNKEINCGKGTCDCPSASLVGVKPRKVSKTEEGPGKASGGGSKDQPGTSSAEDGKKRTHAKFDVTSF